LLPAEASLLFGRGLRAGVDRREQKKQAAAHEAELMRKIREAQVSYRSPLRHRAYLLSIQALTCCWSCHLFQWQSILSAFICIPVSFMR
jgi:hypothetical protein